MLLSVSFVIISLFSYPIYGLNSITYAFNQSNGYSLEPDFNQTQCFDDLGCFPVLSLIDELNSFIGFLPVSPQYLNVTFLLFSCNQTNRYTPTKFGYKPDNQSILNSTFNPNFKTKFIVHGWRESYVGSPWLEAMKEYILSQSCNYNVIIVDWSSGADLLNYFQSAANTRVVGALTAYFINRLLNATQASPQDFQLIGHSLGAHLVGFAGAIIQSPKIGEISGLDPAGPGFMDNNPNTRLDKNDANLVNVLHTNAGGFGLAANLGHYDFYANGGSIQPDCSLSNILPSISLTNFTTDFNDIFCNHQQSRNYPIVVPNNTCQFIAYKCDSYQNFLDGQCADCGSDGEKCKPWEFNFNFWQNSSNYRTDQTQPNQLYIKTSDNLQSLCLFHYQVLVNTSSNSLTLYGTINISLNGAIQLNATLTQLFLPGQQYTFLLTSSQNLGLVTTATVNSDLFPFTGPTISQIGVKYMSNILQSVRNSFSSNLCPVSNQVVGGPVQFQTC